MKIWIFWEKIKDLDKKNQLKIDFLSKYLKNCDRNNGKLHFSRKKIKDFYQKSNWKLIFWENFWKIMIEINGKLNFLGQK